MIHSGVNDQHVGEAQREACIGDGRAQGRRDPCAWVADRSPPGRVDGLEGDGRGGGGSLFQADCSGDRSQ